MNRNSKRMLSIILSTCLVISMYHGEIIAIRPKEREDYVPEFCGIKENSKKLGLNYAFNTIESLSCTFFTDGKVESYTDAVKSDTKKYAKFFHNMLNRGIALAPAQFEAMFVSSVHSDDDIEKTIKAHYESLKGL